VFKYLEIPKTFSCSSELNINSSAEERVLDICKEYGASEYVNPIGGVQLYDKKSFGEQGVSLNFLKKKAVFPDNAPVYWEDNASMLDLIFHCKKQELIGLLSEYSFE